MNAAKDTSSRSHAVFIIVPLGGSRAQHGNVGLLENGGATLGSAHELFCPLYILYLYIYIYCTYKYMHIYDYHISYISICVSSMI